MMIVISGMVGMFGMLKNSVMLKNSGMLRISNMSGQTSSFIPFRKHNLELILMMMGFSVMVGMSGMSGITEMLIMLGKTSSIIIIINIQSETKFLCT